jgi:hypothetical protein
MAKNSDPSAEQIAELTAEIRATWSPTERMRRLRCDLRPSVTLCDGRPMTMAAEDYNDHHEQREALQEVTR